MFLLLSFVQSKLWSFRTKQDKDVSHGHTDTWVFGPQSPKLSIKLGQNASVLAQNSAPQNSEVYQAIPILDDSLPCFFFTDQPPHQGMETESCPRPQVKATLQLGTESYSVQADKGSLSEQLVSLKQESMIILKDFITKHNIPHDVPDEPLEASSEDDHDDTPEKPQVKCKKTKLT